jgi:four helix bundle protein
VNRDELAARTKDFAKRVLRMAAALPGDHAGDAIGRQICRSACSVAANYRAALRGKTRADFANKITTVLEEADETLFWLEMTAEMEFVPAARLQPLLAEADELVRIFTATRATTRNHQS